MEGTTNLPVLFVGWWYSEAFRRVLVYVKAFYIFATDFFSVKICLKTLFAPWKRDMISYEGLSIQQKFQVWTLNLASRFVGFVVKSITLLSYLVFIIFISVFSLTLIFVWIFYPLIIAVLIIYGIRTMIV